MHHIIVPSDRVGGIITGPIERVISPGEARKKLQEIAAFLGADISFEDLSTGDFLMKTSDNQFVLACELLFKDGCAPGFKAWMLQNPIPVRTFFSRVS